jgi:hypothetical protein
MNHFSLRSSLLMICIFALHAVAAQCPEGKSEVTVVTPNGVSKTICVGSKAIEGLEAAQEYAPVDLPLSACPCFSLWTGTYSQDTYVTGSPPVLPKDLSNYACVSYREASSINLGYLSAAGPGLDDYFAAVVQLAEDGRHIDGCVAGSNSDGSVAQSIGSLFPDEDLGDGTITDTRMQACQTILESRGCPF